MIHINFLAASKLQAAVECLPATCADDHRDRYSAGQGEIEMTVTETEIVIANDIIDYLEEYVRQKRCDATTVATLVMARLFVHDDEAMHVNGIEFSKRLGEIMPGAGL